MHDTIPLAMMPAPSPEFEDEARRLAILEDFEPQALEDDPELQAIVDFAAKLAKAPASMVTLIDDQRQYFLARTGVEERATPREVSFCTYALGKPDMLEVGDATLDPRFAENPLVTGPPGVRYYAGQPLISAEGAPLGTLCVIDLKARARPLNQFQREGMAVLAQAAMRRLRARRAAVVATREIKYSDERFQALADSMPDIAFSADHDGNFDYFNQRWQEFTGIPLPYTEDKGRQIMHEDDYEAIIADWQKSVREGAPFERQNRLRRADGKWRWMIVRALPVDVGKTGRRRWFGTMTDIDDTHKLSESRDMLAKELSHRIKNIFAVIGGLVSLQARKEPDHSEFADRLTKTLHALGRAHDFVRPSAGATQDSLHGLLEMIFSPYRNDAGDLRISVNGDEGKISHNAATPMALIFHELATNSSKYGALSLDGGEVTLDITHHGESIKLLWKERGGPPARDPGTTGFGTRLVDLAVSGQLQGRWERRFVSDGLEVELHIPQTAIAP